MFGVVSEGEGGEELSSEYSVEGLEASCHVSLSLGVWACTLTVTLASVQVVDGAPFSVVGLTNKASSDLVCCIFGLGEVRIECVGMGESRFVSSNCIAAYF